MSLTTFRLAPASICLLACVCRKACAPITFAATPALRAYSRIRYRIAPLVNGLYGIIVLTNIRRVPMQGGRSLFRYAVSALAIGASKGNSICMLVFGRRTEMTPDCQSEQIGRAHV